MTATINTLAEADEHFVLGETLRPLLTNAMGSSIEVFDTTGPVGAGPPPHRHPWEEIYVVVSGELQVTIGDGARSSSDLGAQPTSPRARRTPTATSPSATS